MTKYYLELDYKDIKKVREFCEENNINIKGCFDAFPFVADEIVETIEETDNTTIEELFSEYKDTEYERLHVSRHMQDVIISILDDNFDVLKEQFYNNIKFRKELKENK